MTVPPRRATPALLQIDAILVRLAGADALAEIARYLTAEFDSYRSLAVYHREDPVLKRSAWGGPGPEPPGELPMDAGGAGTAVRDGGASRSPPNADPSVPVELAVAVEAAGARVGALVVVARPGATLDGSDRRFLTDVARRIAPTLSAGPSLRLL